MPNTGLGPKETLAIVSPYPPSSLLGDTAIPVEFNNSIPPTPAQPQPYFSIYLLSSWEQEERRKGLVRMNENQNEVGWEGKCYENLKIDNRENEMSDTLRVYIYLQRNRRGPGGTLLQLSSLRLLKAISIISVLFLMINTNWCPRSLTFEGSSSLVSTGDEIGSQSCD